MTRTHQPRPYPSAASGQESLELPGVAGMPEEAKGRHQDYLEMISGITGGCRRVAWVEGIQYGLDSDLDWNLFVFRVHNSCFSRLA